MSRLEKMKENYNQIPIPKELNVRIQQEIQKSQRQLLMPLFVELQKSPQTKLVW